MAIHRKKHLGQAAVTSAATPSLPEPIASVDEKITQENIQTHGFHKDKNPPVTKRVRWLLATHPLAVAVIVVGFLSLFGVIVLAANASNNQPNNGGDIATAGDDTEVVQTYDYGTDDETAADTSEQTGSESSSGTGTNATDVQSTAKPSTPTKLGLSAQTYEILVSWGKAAGATQYEIQLATNSSLSSARQITSGATAAVVPGLSPNTTYFVRIRAVNANGASGWSAVKSIRTAPAPSPQSPQQPLPAKVGAVSAKVNSTASVTVSWSATAHATRYSVIRATNSAMSSGRKEYAATTKRSYTVSDLKSGTKYYFLVRASNSRGYGPNSNVISAKTRIGKAGITAATLFSNNNITVKYSASAGATGYVVRYSTSSTFGSAKSVTSTSTSATLTNLNQRTKYYVQVRAVDGTYKTPWSSSVYVTTGTLPITLKIATLNTRFDTAANNVVADVKTIINNSGASIIALQEMAGNNHRQVVREKLVSCSSCHYGMYSPSGYGKTELAILWDKNVYSLLSTSAIKATDERTVENKNATGTVTLRPLYVNVVRLKVKLNGRTVQVLNNHLPSHIDNGGVPAGNKPKRLAAYDKNIQAITNKLQSISNDTATVFVTGDFNVDYRADATKRNSHFPYKALGNQNTYASYRYLGAPAGTTFVGQNRLIDYIFMRKISTSTVLSHSIIKNLHSDHNAVVARVRIQ